MNPHYPYPPPWACTVQAVPGGQSEAPARVRLAAEVLGQLTAKAMSRVACNDVAIEVIDGARLTTAEANLQATAANAITDYLRGNLEPDFWERQRAASEATKVGLEIDCWACASGGTVACHLCRGNGRICVTPAGPPLDEGGDDPGVA